MRLGQVHVLKPDRETKISARDAEALKKGLARLVFCLLKLLKELMERQAIKRMPSLEPEKQEEIGLQLMLLDEKLRELMNSFGIREHEIQLEVAKNLDSLVNDFLTRVSGVEKI